MRFQSMRETYLKGMLLEAARLNADFDLDFFLLEHCANPKSDGLLSGLLTVVKEGALYVEKGVFRLQGELGWLMDKLPVEMPPLQKWCKLWLQGGNGSWNLEWREDKEEGSGLCLCRLMVSSPDLIRNSWLDEKDEPGSLAKWQARLTVPDYIQLEFAMSASWGTKAGLLPELQRKLAHLTTDRQLKLWLQNGLLPLQDYYNTDKREEALKMLAQELAGKPVETTVGNEEKNLAF